LKAAACRPAPSTLVREPSATSDHIRVVTRCTPVSHNVSPSYVSPLAR
jgi:hypothetical protein